MSLRLDNLTIYKQDGEALFSSFNLHIASGEIVALMGPSGCGKSTLLDLIAGHLSKDFYFHGNVILNGQSLASVPAHRRQVGILFQDDFLFPHLTVLENLAFALPNEVKGKRRIEQAKNALDSIELTRLAHSYPEQISGGQRARIALTRMLLAKPKLVLLDEPFSKLDTELRGQFRDWVVKQLQQAHIPALMVTHDSADVPANSVCLTWPWGASHVG